MGVKKGFTLKGKSTQWRNLMMKPKSIVKTSLCVVLGKYRL